MTLPAHAPTIEEIREASVRLAPHVVRMPLVRLNVDGLQGEVWLKLETLQPIGSFKLRGALNTMLQASPTQLEHGVYTASAGNMAQGVAWGARRLGVRCRVIVPDHAPAAKIDAVERLGGEVRRVPFDRWWQILVDHRDEGEDGLFIHPVSDRTVIAGNGTIGLEIADELPDVDTVVVPYGGGGLSVGISLALRQAAPRARVYAAEVETAAPLAPSLAAGERRAVGYRATFVDGIGGKSVLEEMWPLASAMLAGSHVVSVAAIANAIRTLVLRNRVVAEGAGAAPVAAVMEGLARGERIVCVVSGGNIDAEKLATILRGDVP